MNASKRPTRGGGVLALVGVLWDFEIRQASRVEAGVFRFTATALK